MRVERELQAGLMYLWKLRAMNYLVSRAVVYSGPFRKGWASLVLDP